MSDFRIWGRITHVGPSEFLAVVSAVPDDGIQRGPDPIVRTALSDSLEQAKGDLEVLTVVVGDAIRAQGGRVVDVLSE